MGSWGRSVLGGSLAALRWTVIPRGLALQPVSLTALICDIIDRIKSLALVIAPEVRGGSLHHIGMRDPGPYQI